MAKGTQESPKYAITLYPPDQLKRNPKNPRVIEDSDYKKLVKSIKKFPKMLHIRPVVINQDFLILGGDKRYQAAVDAKLKMIPCIMASDLTEAEEAEFIIKDNLHSGDWNMQLLETDWDASLLQEFGLEFEEPVDENMKIQGQHSSNNTSLQYLSFGKHKVPVTDEELDRLDRLLLKYSEDNSVIIGFASMLLDHAENA